MSDLSKSEANTTPQPTLGSEGEMFLKSAGGGQSQNTARTYSQGLAHFTAYLEQTQGWQADRPIAELTPEMVQ